MPRLAYFVYDIAVDDVTVGDIDDETSLKDVLKDTLNVGDEAKRFHNDLDRTTDLVTTMRDWDFILATRLVN